MSEPISSLSRQAVVFCRGGLVPLNQLHLPGDEASLKDGRGAMAF